VLLAAGSTAPSDGILSKIGISLSLFDVLLLLLLLMIPIVIWQIKTRWITANANEWLLLVENGKLVQSGIGLTVFKGLNSVVVRFPSFIQV